MGLHSLAEDKAKAPAYMLALSDMLQHLVFSDLMK